MAASMAAKPASEKRSCVEQTEIPNVLEPIVLEIVAKFPSENAHYYDRVCLAH